MVNGEPKQATFSTTRAPTGSQSSVIDAAWNLHVGLFVCLINIYTGTSDLKHKYRQLV
jgi:hypothetical protein